MCGVCVRIGQQQIRFRTAKYGRDGCEYFRPAVDVEHVAPLFEKRREKVELVVLEEFVSEFTRLGIYYVYFGVGFGTEDNIGAIMNDNLVGVGFDEWMGF
jgi:hypothetical protein